MKSVQTLHCFITHLNSICLSCRVTMATRGGRPVLSSCSSTLDAMICVVISASAATPAPQQLQEGAHHWSDGSEELHYWPAGRRPSLFQQHQVGDNCKCQRDSLNPRSNVVNLWAVLVGHHHVVCSPGVCAQDHAILEIKKYLGMK